MVQKSKLKPDERSWKDDFSRFVFHLSALAFEQNPGHEIKDWEGLQSAARKLARICLSSFTTVGIAETKLAHAQEHDGPVIVSMPFNGVGEAKANTEVDPRVVLELIIDDAMKSVETMEEEGAMTMYTTSLRQIIRHWFCKHEWRDMWEDEALDGQRHMFQYCARCDMQRVKPQ
jgi:hypothetical protein